MKKNKILVVDDSRNDARVLIKGLNDYVLQVANNGKKAIEIAESSTASFSSFVSIRLAMPIH